MKEMGWSWSDLQEAPFDLVHEILIRATAESKWKRQKDKLKESIQAAQDLAKR